MLNRVTFISAAVLGALLFAGCSKTAGPVAKRGPAIGFRAGSALLLDDAQTRASIIEGTQFGNGDVFTVFGTRNSGDSHTVIFDGVDVRNEGSSWTYANPRFWWWENSSDYYDFVAVYPAGKGTARMDINGNLAVSTPYDIASDNYDILGATFRRRGNVADRTSTVEMGFSHMASAVRVVILNNSDLTSVRIDSIEYKNLVVCGDAKVTLDLYGATSLSWINTERNTSKVRKTVIPAADGNVAHGARYTAEYDLMIPERLDQSAAAGNNEADMPRLFIHYTPQGGVSSTANILLKDVKRQDNTSITSWEPGVKYNYYVSMRLDGGVLVSIVTTAWDEVEAETPGLLI